MSAVTVGGLKDTAYTVRLYFAEPATGRPAKRIFDVSLQGNRVLQDFDIAEEAGGPMRAVVKQFKNIRVQGKLDVALSARTGVPVLCGIETVAEALSIGPIPVLQSSRSGLADNTRAMVLGPQIGICQGKP